MARKCDEAVGVESPDSITRRRVILVEEAAEQGPPANVAPVDRDWLLDREIFRTLDAAADGLTRFATYYNYDRLHGELDWHTPAERYDGTPFTARGFERVPALDHLQGWLAALLTA